MTITGLQLRALIARKRRELARLGQGTAAATTTTLIDTLRLRGDTLAVDQFGAEAWIRFTSGTNAGFVGKVDQLSGATGTITFSPAAGSATASGDGYEIWRRGIFPDEPDAARDRALTQRCSLWRLKPLSVLSDVETWAGKINGTEILTPTAMAFPDQLFAQSLVVDNDAGGTDGGAKSETYYVQPGQPFRLTGDVSVHLRTATIRVRDISNGVDIALSGTQQFTQRGWQRFAVTGVAPATCGAIQVWVSGVDTDAIVEWAGVALLPTDVTRFTLSSRVLSETEVASVFAWRGPVNNARRPDWVRVEATRRRSGAAVEIVLAQPANNFGGFYYMEQHHYAALQTDYLTVSDRTTGDTATTDCPIEYLEAAAVVELLENMDQDDVLNKVYMAALKDLGFWERKVGAMPVLVEEQSPTGARPFAMRL